MRKSVNRAFTSMLVLTFLFGITWMPAWAQCVSGDQVVAALSVDIRADDLDGVMYPATITVGGVVRRFVTPGQQLVEIGCPVCSGNAYSIVTKDGLVVNGSLSTTDDVVWVPVGVGGNGVEFTLTATNLELSFTPPSPVSSIALSGGLCNGEITTATAVSENIVPGTAFEWSVSLDGISYSPLAGMSQAINYVLPAQGSGRVHFRVRARLKSTSYCGVSRTVFSSYAEGVRDFFVAAPVVNKELSFATAPTCPNGGDGSFTIRHSAIQPGVKYIYSIAKLSLGKDCPAVAEIPEVAPLPGYCVIAGANAENTDGAQEFTINQLNLLDNLQLGVGKYLIRIEADDGEKESCFNTYEFDIPPPPQMTLSVTGSNSPSCLGGMDGTVNFTITNGVGPFTARIDGNGYDGEPRFDSRNYIRGNLIAGDHVLHVSDNCGYEASVNFAVAEGQAINFSKTITNATCLSNAQVAITVAPVLNRNHTYNLGGLEIVSDLANATFTSLAASTYELSVEVSGCTKPSNQNVAITGPSNLTKNPATAVNTSCSNSTNGQINLTGVTKQNGTLSYSVTLTSPGHNDIVAGPFGNATASINNVPPGTYSVAVHDLCGTTDPPMQVGLVVSAPNPISISQRSNIELACFDGTTSGLSALSVTGGTNSFVLDVLKDGVSMASYPIPNSTSRSLPINGLSLGSYIYRVTENCPVAGVQDATAQSAFAVSSTATSAVSATVNAPLKDSNGNGVIGQGDFHISCNGAIDGVINVSVTGGVLRPTGNRYLLTLLNSVNSTVNGVSIVETGSNGTNWLYTISGVGQGSYRVRIEDGNACQRTFPGAGVSLTAPAPLTITAPNINSPSHFSGLVLHQGQLYVTCKGGMSGVFHAFAQGGNSPYSFRLYRRTSVAQPWPMNPIAAISNITNGTATFASLGAGQYQVQVSDQQNCSSPPQYFEILEAATPLQFSSVTPHAFGHGANTSCVGSSDGSILLIASGGVGDYTYSLTSTNGLNSSSSKPGNAQTFSNLPAVNGAGLPIIYTYSLVDQLGCHWQAGNPVPGEIQLSSPQPLQVSREVTTRTVPLFEIPCRGDMATVRFASQGGLYPHRVSIGSEIKIINNANDAVEFTLPSGDYIASFSDGLNCTAPNQVFSLREPATHVTASIGEIHFPVCIGGEGTVNVIATGGVMGSQGEEYAFVVRQAELQEAVADTLRGTAQQLDLPANGFQSQAYIVKAVDALGCEDEQDFLMPVNPLPLSVSVTNQISPSCHGGTNGSISIQVDQSIFMEGGQLRFFLAGGHLRSEVIEEMVNGPTYTFLHLQGTDIDDHEPYRVWVEDNNHCVDTAFQYLPSVQLPSPEPLHLELLRSTRPSCYSGQDGSILVQASGGVGGYQLSFDGVSFTDLSADHRVHRTNLSAGSYPFFLRDANFQPDQPACLLASNHLVETGRFLRLSTVDTPISCKSGMDGAIDLTVELDNTAAGESIHTERLEYVWRNSANSGTIVSNQQDVTGLRSGVYTVAVRYDLDTATCRQEKTIPVLEPASRFRVADVKTYPARCGTTNTGSALVTVAGGWPSRPSTYRIGGGPWVPFSGSHFLVTGLLVGLQHLEIAQLGNCGDALDFEVISEIFTVEALLVKEPSCPHYSDAVLQVTSAMPNAEFSVNGLDFQTVSMFENLNAGVHTMQARSKANSSCVTAVEEVEILDPTDCEQPLTLQVAPFQSSFCANEPNGSAKAIVTGGVEPYQFYWDGSGQQGSSVNDGLTSGPHTVRVVDAVKVVREASFFMGAKPALDFDYAAGLSSCPTTCDGTLQIIVNRTNGRFLITWTGATGTGEVTLDQTNIGSIETLCRGAYTVQITDLGAPACQVTKEIQVGSYPLLEVKVTDMKPPTCFGGIDANASVKVVGGSNLYAITWNNNQTGARLAGVPAGSYLASVVDTRLGCTAVAQLVIPEAPKIEVRSENITMPTCFGRSDGSVELTLANASNPLVIWSGNKVGTKVSGLKAGEYAYQVTSANGCHFESSVTVPEPAPLVGTPATIAPSCNQSSDGQASLQISGGTTPYSVFWSSGQRQTTIKGLRKGDLNFRLVDRNGCTATSTVSVIAPEPLTLQATQMKDVSCNRGNDGFIQVDAIGGVGPYTYTWSTGQTGSLNAGLKKGRYSVAVLDQHQCFEREQYTISEPSTLRVVTDQVILPSCASTFDGSIAVSIAGGVTPYLIRWASGQDGVLLNNIGAGDYSVVVEDGNACVATSDFTLPAPSPLEIVNTSVTNPSCFQFEDGKLSFSVAGGTMPIEISWQHGPTTSSLQALSAGLYEVKVRDGNHCDITRSFELVEPSEIVLTGVANETIICTGTSALFEAEGHWIRYQWVGPTGVNHETPRYETNEPGLHQLTAWDERNCPTSVAFSLEVSDQPISPDFLRLSEPIVFEPVVFVDITHPIPTFSEWILPEDPDIVVNSMESGKMELVFTRTGNFDIGLRSWLNDCQSDISKVVVVLDTPPVVSSGRTREETAGIQVDLHPTPAGSELSLLVRQCSVEPLDVEIVSAVDHRVVFNRQFFGHTEYGLTWDVRTWQPGMYFLIYRQGLESGSVRLMIAR